MMFYQTGTISLWFLNNVANSVETKFLHKTTLSQQLPYIFAFKCAGPDHFLDHPTYSTFLEILVPKNGSCFSHLHPEIDIPNLGIYEEIIKNISNK